jgi:D-beta-D-heptose 7-phosphate kinase/D-beta-D-heptose 1-phosphate adenosyltransferase
MQPDSHALSWISWAARHGRPVRVGVVGDLMLDEYLDGRVSRISPEAPVPVHLVTGASYSAGGAANVARNIKLAGGEPVLFGTFGRDEAAERLRAILAADGVATDHVLVLDGRPTIRKTRVTANHQQLVRIDWEEVSDLPADARAAILAAVAEQELDAIVLSDYGKGVLGEAMTRDVLRLARERGVPSVVDPKGDDYARYGAAFLITPNHKEAIEAARSKAAAQWAPERLARTLQASVGCTHVLVTLGPKGMVLVSGGDAAARYLPAEAREVYDVSGAGDTVVAVMALAIGAGEAPAQAMVTANVAAGRVVEKWGTQPITRSELEARCGVRAGAGATGDGAKVVELAEALFGRLPASQPLVVVAGVDGALDEDLLDTLEGAAQLGSVVVRLAPRAGETAAMLRRRARLVAAWECVALVLLDPSPDAVQRLGNRHPTTVIDARQTAGAAVAMARAERAQEAREVRS